MIGGRLLSAYELSYTQAITNETTIYLDTEKANSKTITISGYEAYLYSEESVMYAMWLYDGYYFELTCYGDFGEDDMINLIQSISHK